MGPSAHLTSTCNTDSGQFLSFAPHGTEHELPYSVNGVNAIRGSEFGCVKPTKATILQRYILANYGTDLATIAFHFTFGIDLIGSDELSAYVQRSQKTYQGIATTIMCPVYHQGYGLVKIPHWAGDWTGASLGALSSDGTKMLCDGMHDVLCLSLEVDEACHGMVYPVIIDGSQMAFCNEGCYRPACSSSAAYTYSEWHINNSITHHCAIGQTSCNFESVRWHSIASDPNLPCDGTSWSCGLDDWEGGSMTVSDYVCVPMQCPPIEWIDGFEHTSSLLYDGSIAQIDIQNYNRDNWNCPDTHVQCVGDSTDDWRVYLQGTNTSSAPTCYRRFCSGASLQAFDAYDGSLLNVKRMYSSGQDITDSAYFAITAVNLTVIDTNDREYWCGSEVALTCDDLTDSFQHSLWTPNIQCYRRFCTDPVELRLQPGGTLIAASPECDETHCDMTDKVVTHNNSKYTCAIESVCRTPFDPYSHSGWDHPQIDCYLADCDLSIVAYGMPEGSELNQGPCEDSECVQLEIETQGFETTDYIVTIKNDTHFCPRLQCKHPRDALTGLISGVAHLQSQAYAGTAKWTHQLQCYDREHATCPSLQVHTDNGMEVLSVFTWPSTLAYNQSGFMWYDCSSLSGKCADNDQADLSCTQLANVKSNTLDSFCRPRVNGYMCPELRCEWDEHSVAWKGLLWTETESSFHPEDNINKHTCLPTEPPTQAPTMVFPQSAEENPLQVGFTCSMDPFDTGSAVGERCVHSQSLCHPTAAALAGTPTMYRWSACPVHGCGAGQACLYDIENGCGCAAYSPPDVQSWHVKEAASYCDTGEPRSCDVAVKAIGMHGTPVQKVPPGADTPYGCSIEHDMLQVRSDTECVQTNSMAVHLEETIINYLDRQAEDPTACQTRCNDEPQCVHWMYAVDSFEADIQNSIGSYNETVTHRLQAGECRLLAFVAEYVNVTGTLYSGARECRNERQDCGLAIGSLSRAAGESAQAHIERCKSTCMQSSLGCNTFERSGDTCAFYRCEQFHSARTGLYIGSSLYRRGLSYSHREPEGQDSPVGSLVCQGEPARYFPMSATDIDQTAHRSRESCPSNYSEISTVTNCEEASKYIRGLGRFNYELDNSYNCVADGDRVSSSTFKVAPTVTTFRSREQCARHCFEHEKCNFFLWYPAIPGVSSMWGAYNFSQVLASDVLSAYLYRRAESLPVMACANLTAVKTLDSTDDAGRLEECTDYCYEQSGCAKLRVVGQMCEMHKEGSCGLGTVPLYSLERLHTVEAQSTCTLFAHCEQGTVQTITLSNAGSHQLIRSSETAVVTPPEQAMSKPPGCYAETSGDGAWGLYFNKYRNMLSWAADSPYPHDKYNSTYRSEYDPNGGGTYRRICARHEGDWANSWRTLDYGASAEVGVYKKPGVWSPPVAYEGVNYTLAPDHGMACPAGYDVIASPRQCRLAAQALGVTERIQPLQMQWQGETWYLVRRVHGSSAHWHAATDDLRGSAHYGVYRNESLADSSFSIPFGENYTRVLLATGDMSQWLVLDRYSGCLGQRADLLLGNECGPNAMKTLDVCRELWYPDTSRSSFQEPVAMSCRVLFPEDSGAYNELNSFDPRVLTDPNVIISDRVAAPGETLYAEAALSSEGKHALPESGANVWVNWLPNDGFEHSRAEQVPGCSLDTALAPTELDLPWYSASSRASVHQHGDGLINFNTKALASRYGDGSVLLDSNVFSEHDVALFQRGDGWLRGRAICASRVLPMYEKISNNYMFNHEIGYECPPNTEAVNTLDACLHVYNALYVKGLQSGESIVWMSPHDFVSTTMYEKLVPYYVPRCLRLPEGTITYNPIRTSEFEQLSVTLRNSDNERAGYLFPLGQQVCRMSASVGVNEEDWYTYKMFVEVTEEVQMVSTVPAKAYVQQALVRLAFVGSVSVDTALVDLVREGFEQLLFTVSASRSGDLIHLSFTAPRHEMGQRLTDIRNALSGHTLLLWMTHNTETTHMQSVTSIQLADFSLSDVPGEWTMQAKYDLTSDKDKYMWWQSVCDCDSEGRDCPRQLERVFRATNVVLPEAARTVLSSSSEDCALECERTEWCAVALSAEAGGYDWSCALVRDIEILLDLQENAAFGEVAVFVDINKCPNVYMDSVSVCTEQGCRELADEPLRYLPEHADTAPLLMVSAPIARHEQCWAHNDTRVLCEDGSLHPLRHPGDPSKTPECQNSTKASSRFKCPLSHPYMCSYRHEKATDMHCASEPSECNTLGGLRPCNWIGYSADSIPSFEQLPYDPAAAVDTHVLSRSFESELGIDSVSRCGGPWVTVQQRTHAVSNSSCATGFACCDPGGGCECPRTSLPADDAAFESSGGQPGGFAQFAGACHPRLYR